MFLYKRIFFVFGALIVPLSALHAAPGGSIVTTVDCEKSPYSGSWVSNDKDNPFLSKLRISDECQQIVSRPVAANNPWAGALGQQKKYVRREFTLRPTSTCYPADCTWGRALGLKNKKGYLKAQFRMFLSQRFLEMSHQKNTLLVRWRIEYNGRKKPDELGETLLVRAH